MARLKLKIQRPWIPYIILALTLTLTILSTYYVSRATGIEDRLRFLSAVQDTTNNITDRMNIYITLLRGTAGLYASNSDISQQQFNNYVDRLNLQKNYPALQGIGFIQVVNNTDKNSFIQSMQNEGNQQFSIYPSSKNNDHYVVRYFDPRTNQPSSPVGYDLGTDLVRLKALETARDTGLSIMSGKVNLQSKNSNKMQTGFFIFTPVYYDDEVPSTLAEKRSKIWGFVYSPFESNIFFSGILGKNTLPEMLNIQIYDQNQTNKANLIYNSKTDDNQLSMSYFPKFITTKNISVAGETWTAIFTNHPEFETEENLSFFIFIGGLLVSIMLFMLSRSQYIARTNAEITTLKLQYSQKELQKSIGMRDNFISIASHELKTPVTSLKVYAEMLLRQFSKKGDSQTTDYLTKIIKQIDKLTLLIQDLLNVTRIQSNQLTFRIERFDINIMAKEVIESTQQITSRHRITLRGKATKKVWGDRERISQVLINLLTNSLKYSPKSNKVIVILKDDKNSAIISVKDYGIGISKVHQKKIFDRFYRISETNEKTFPGLGIGLFISQTIIKRHGGEIMISSERGKGSTFTFTLPYSQKKIVMD